MKTNGPMSGLYKALLAAGATILAAGVLLGVVFSVGHTSASAGGRNWIATGWNIHLLDQATPVTTAHFFDTAGSNGTGADPTTSPVLDGLDAAPALVYTSYAQFASDIASGAITYQYHWVTYDPENWAQTPLAEQQDPGTYLRQFAQLAHANGLQAIETPSRDLGLVPGAVCGKQTGETLNQWYIRCGIAGKAAYADVIVVQDQVNTTSLADYGWLYNNARAQAQAASPGVMVDAEVSTNYGTPAQMAAAAQSVSADGYYVSITGTAIASATQFFQAMQAAGYLWAAGPGGGRSLRGSVATTAS
jgi:hypothetical protein